MLNRIKLLKLSTLGVFGLLAIVYCFHGSPAKAFSSGPPASRTGAPTLGTFPAESTCAACHNQFPLNSGPGTLTISGLPDTYTANQEIIVTVTLNQTDRQRYGFEATLLDDQGQKAGEISLTEENRTRLVNGAGNFLGRQYVSHSSGGFTPNGTDQNSWTFKWKAPAQPVGRVTLYVAGNAANGNGTNQGDFIYTKNASTQPSPVLGTFTSVNAASFSPMTTAAPDAIFAGFGTGLAQELIVAASIPLPTLLGDTEVEVKDSAGDTRKAGLFAVSATQINYLVPSGTANGTATVTVKRSGNAVSQGTLTVDTVGPGLFTANLTGSGVPAAIVLRSRNGVNTFELVPTFNPTTGRFESSQIDVGREGEQVFLIVFGTGFRSAPPSTVSATVGGTATTAGAGAVIEFAGLDQGNISLPPSLAGRNGLVDVVFSAGGKNANTVQIFIK